MDIKKTLNYYRTKLLGKKYIDKQMMDESFPGNLGLEKSDIIEILKSSKDLEQFINNEYIERLGLNSSDVIELIKATGEADKYLTTEKLQELNIYGSDRIELIKATGEIDKYLTSDKLQELGLYSSDCVELIKATGEIDKYLTSDKLQELGLYNSDRMELIIETGNIQKYITPEKIKEYITPEKSSELHLTKSQICKLIKETNNIEEYINPENCEKLGITIKDIFDHIISEDITEESLKKLADYGFENKETIISMYNSNHDIVNADIGILDEKYIQALGEDKINLISCYPEIVSKIKKCDTSLLSFMSRCINNYQEINKTEEWTPIFEKLLENVDSYEELIKAFGDEKLDDKNLEKITTMLCHQNTFEITTIEAFENFGEIKDKKCKELFESDNISDKKNAILISKMGISMREAERIIEKYGEGIESIENEDLKYFVKALKELKSIGDEQILKEVFEEVSPVENQNVFAVERNLKTEYGKVYMKNLFSVDQADKIEGEENVFELPINSDGHVESFNMIITGVAAFNNESNTKSDEDKRNYYESWNRPSIKTQHFCASYIGEKSLKRAESALYYGFSNMSDDSLLMAGTGDIMSSTSEFVPSSSKDQNFASPEQLIETPNYYNELDFRRIQNGERKQPDYIVVFKKDGELQNMDVAREASKQFQDATGQPLPIIIVDEDLCEITSKAQSKLEPNTEQKLESPSKTSKKVTLAECEQCHQEVGAEERTMMVSVFKDFYKGITKMKEQERDGEEK